MPSGVITDTSGNPFDGIAADALDFTIAAPPTATINQGAGQADPANTGPILFDVVFSEAVTGFDGSDIAFAGSTVSGTLVANVSGSGANYIVSVTGMTSSGTVVASIGASAAQDVAQSQLFLHQRRQHC